jgi:hypothetical protein
MTLVACLGPGLAHLHFRSWHFHFRPFHLRMAILTRRFSDLVLELVGDGASDLQPC